MFATPASWRMDEKTTSSVRSAAASAMLSDRSLRSGFRPVACLALFGEFNAGKSSVINLLLGRDVLPTAVLSTTRRPTYVRYAAAPLFEAISADGRRRPIAPDGVKTQAQESVNHFEIGLPNKLLLDFELIDTPGFADPNNDPRSTLDVLDDVDICIWCTLATQAWRHSERQTWLSLPPRLRTHGILVATHIDTLAYPGERERVRSRLEHEARDLFGDIVLLSVPDAMRAKQADGGIADPDLWRQSGGKALAAALGRAAVEFHKIGGSSEGLPPEASADLQTFLTTVMETVPACRAAAWIDLAERRVLRLNGTEGNGGNARLGQAIADLLRGEHIRKVDQMTRRPPRPARGDSQSLKEVIISSKECVGILLLAPFRPDRALVIIHGRTANLGAVLVQARDLIAGTGHLV
jgi:dynamin family protein